MAASASATTSTSATGNAIAGAISSPRRPGRFARFLRRNPLAAFGLMIFSTWIILSVAAPLFSRYPPLKQNVTQRLKPPGEQFTFGSDQLGRDVQSRVFHAGRVSLPGGIVVVIIASIIGVTLGAIAGYFGGWVDEFLMRLTEVFLAFPTIILAMVIAAALGPSLINAVIALVVVWWPNYARLMRAQVLTVKSKEFVEAARALGAPGRRLLLRSILPNCIAPVIVLATTDVGNAILVFAGLSFLGLGPDPSVPEWGRQIADGIKNFDQWWMAAFPGLAIFTVVIAVNFIGDAIRDALDPRLRGQ
jgi:peptide/nickel transport system permease protein